jgi:hypothetical protein
LLLSGLKTLGVHKARESSILSPGTTSLAIRVQIGDDRPLGGRTRATRLFSMQKLVEQVATLDAEDGARG